MVFPESNQIHDAKHKLPAHEHGNCEEVMLARAA
jgi:hypothetical protein